MAEKMEINAVMYFDYVSKCFKEIAEAADRLSVKHKQLKDISEIPNGKGNLPEALKALMDVPETYAYFNTDEGAATDTLFIKDKLIEVVEFIATTQPHYDKGGD